MLTPIDPDSKADPTIQELLKDLQSGILKAHGLNHVQLVRVQFAGAAAGAPARAWIAELLEGGHITCSRHQLKTQGFYGLALAQTREASFLKKWGMAIGLVQNPVQKFVAGPEATVFVNLLLTHKGYEFFGRPAGHAEHPVVTPSADHPFITGQRNRPKHVLGEDASAWSAGDWPAVDWHALLMVSSADEDLAKKQAADLPNLAAPGTFARTDALPAGKQQRRGEEAVEHFGYVDGISTMVFLKNDDARARSRGVSSKWNPLFPPEQIIVNPTAKSPRCGSFLVLRQLEQNPKEFLKITAPDLMIGRKADGTPLPPLEPGAPTGKEPTNAFNFGTPAAPLPASKCPFRAHIRKANPRGSTGADAANAGERAVAFARRGVTYGERQIGNAGEFTDFPSAGVGLHFMAYMRDIGAQFEHMQKLWFNRPDFPPGANEGLDPLVGCDYNQNIPPDMNPVVRTMGGEYFFAPPLSLLWSL